MQDIKKIIEKISEEATSLQDKLTKLDDFMLSDKFNNLPQIQKSLLAIQAQAMCTYGYCLVERLRNLKNNK